MFQITTATKKLLALNKRIRAVCGGTSASKTISILMILIDYAQSNNNEKIDVMSESYPHLEGGCISDFKKIMIEQCYWNDDKWNASKHFYTFETGSVIKFISIDRLGKAHGPRRDVLFVNEANNIPWEIYDQLEVRTKKIIWLDWNPSIEFWYYDKIKYKIDHDFVTLTYKDNEALDENIIKSIETHKENKNWWKVYGLGQLGEVEGKIYKDWQIIDEIPHEARLERRGLDFGFTCLSGDTLVDTIQGKKRIDSIKQGDKVLTRKGYKKVLWSGSKGFRNVYRVDFGLNKRIIVTEDHRIFTENGWKQVKDLSNKETICVLRQNLKEGFTEDTQMVNIQTTFTTKESTKVSLSKKYCTGKYIKNLSEKYQKTGLYTTLTKTLSTIIQKTSLPYLIRNITNCTTKTISAIYQKKKCQKSGQEYGILKITGQKGERKLWIRQSRRLRNALNVGKKLSRLILTRNSVVQNVTKDRTLEIKQKNILASNAELYLLHQHIIQETPVLQNVPINSQLLKEKIEVFDLTVEGEPEFFANDVLVHNCDPTVIVDIYRYNNGFIIDEICYQKGLSNKSIADLLNAKDPKILTIADSAEPKSIDEIKNYGVNIIGAIKGQGSVNMGIQYVQDQRISVTARSVKTIKAYRNYLWTTDRDGKIINTPDDTIHEWSNPMDAIRYGLDSFKPKNNTFQQLLKRNESKYISNIYE